MDDELNRLGFFSLLRWRRDPTRDEARNVAVLLVSSEGEFGGLKAAPISAISSKLQDQGIVDKMVRGLEDKFNSADKPTRRDLSQWHNRLQDAIILTEPQPTVVYDFGETLTALFKALVRPPARPSRLTKGRVLDLVIDRLRRSGLDVDRGAERADVIFDAITNLPDGRGLAIEALSFATGAQSWTKVEHDAGHFLFGLERAALTGIAAVQPPPADSNGALSAHERVRRWFDSAGVKVVEPAGVADAINMA